jgi:hypothetical protein
MVAISGILDFGWLASVVALVASLRGETDEYKALEDRLRRPLRWTLAHPVRAIRRLVK